MLHAHTVSSQRQLASTCEERACSQFPDDLPSYRNEGQRSSINFRPLTATLAVGILAIAQSFLEGISSVPPATALQIKVSPSTPQLGSTLFVTVQYDTLY